MFDGKAFGEEMVEIVKGYVVRTIEPVLKRLAALEERQPAPGEPGEKGADGKDGLDGAPGTDGCAGADGKDGRDGADGQGGAKGDPGEAGRDGKDGVGLAGALIDRKGALIVTLTDGSVQELGSVTGSDGKDGAIGQKGADGTDGKDGVDGVDGVGFEDLEVVHDGQRGFSFRFTKGEKVKSFDFSLPVVLDCGVYKTGQEYEPGDAVTFGGSLWIAQAKTSERPEGGDAWRLAVKKGRDGKDAAR